MRVREFKRMIEVDKEEKMNDLEVGEFFLYGSAMINQKQEKKPGQPISYFRVIRKTKNGVEYIPEYDTLKEDKIII